MRKALVLAIGFTALSLTACGEHPATPSSVVYKDRPVEVRVPCPDKTTYDSLTADRPTPLRQQPEPATPEERTAKAMAQLGRYEAEGGWADQVSAALGRCQSPP